MKAQSYLTRMEYVDSKLWKFLFSKLKVKILTHSNKSKKYPYSSDRQRRYGEKNLSMSMFLNKEDMKASQ